MNCFACTKDCPMRYERNMNEAPCRVCARAEHMPTDECWKCIRIENECYFVERETNDTTGAKL